MKLTNNWEAWFSSLQIDILSYSNLKLQPHTMRYLMETHKSLVRGESQTFSKTYVAFET